MANDWKIEGSTHGIDCAGCAEAAEKAITMAKVTGSVGASHNDNGNHAAKVSRATEPEWFECPYDYLMQQGTEGLVAHFAEKHPHMRDEIARLTEGERVLLRSRLQYIDRSYNGPATD